MSNGNAGRFRWHCANRDAHERHGYTGDGYYGPDGYVCDGTADPEVTDDLVTSARKRAAELMDNLRESQAWHDGATMLALASELRAVRDALGGRKE